MAYTLSKILHAHVREEINLFNFFFFYNYKEEDVSLLNKPDEAWPPQKHLLYSLVNIAVRWWAFSDNYWYHAAELSSDKSLKWHKNNVFVCCTCIYIGHFC